MKSEIRRDILRTLKQAIKYLEGNDSSRLKELSDHTIHNASIYQDEDSVSFAVITYALSKIASRSGEIPQSLLESLKNAKESLGGGDLKGYSECVRLITQEIESLDSRMRLYIQKVINNAEIKKGSRIYENGISLARAAEMLRVSQWEMMAYVGKTSILDKDPSFTTNVREKVKITRKIFEAKPRGALVFDSGPIITLTMNHLMWTLDPLKKKFNGSFLISRMVKKELVDTPLESRKFKFEALHTNRYIRKGTLEVYDDESLEPITSELMGLCNSCFRAQGMPIKIVHEGEIESLAIVIDQQSKFIAIDERTTRLLVESPEHVAKILESRLRQDIATDSSTLRRIKRMLRGIKVIRSIEIITYAYEQGLLDRYLPDQPFHRVTLLDAVLWGLKLNGCAVTENEIFDIIALENHLRS